MMKKTFLYIIFTLILMSSLAVLVSADDEAIDFIEDKLLDTAEKIDLTVYSMSVDELSEIFNTLMNTRPELFFVAPSYTYNYTDDGVVLSMTPKYNYTGNSLTSARKVYSKFVDDMTDGVSSSWSDAEKVLYIHDQITVYAEYDIATGNADVYSLAKNRSGTCVAYTLAFIAACREVGIECDVARSDSMNHIWNVVKVDGEWYHVDVTWDDTVPDMKGRSLHDNFLRSDEGIKTASKTPHENWVSDYRCTSSKYDSYVWNTVTSPFVNLDGTWYSVDSRDFTLYKYDIKNNSKTPAAKLDSKEKWRVWDNDSKSYIYAYSGVAAYNSSIYYNTALAVYRYDPVTGNVYEAARPKTDSGYLYYFTVGDGTLEYYLIKDPNTAKTAVKSLNINTGKNMYSVTFMSDGSVYDVRYFFAGDKITAPDAPTSDGKRFSGWEALPDVMPENDIIAVAVFDTAPCEHENTAKRTAKKATCDTDGVSETYCRDCKVVLSTDKIDAAHKPGAWNVSKQATCTDEGLRARECTVCGDVVEREILPKSEIHSFGGWNTAVEPTATDDGLRSRECTLCGYTEEEAIPKLGTDTEETETEPIATAAPETEAIPPETEKPEETLHETEPEPETEPSPSGGGITSLTHENLVIIYVITVISVGIINGLLIYFIVILDRRRHRKK